MTLNEYQLAAMRTNNSRESSDELVNGVMGLCGEAGECIDLVKKHVFQQHVLDEDKLIDELGDVLWYIASIATGLNVTMDHVGKHNIEKLRKRYPDGFSSERSINRTE